MINLFSSDLFLKYSFLFSFIVYRILMVIVQYYFLISFTNVNSKFWCFILYSIISIFLIIINTYFNLYNLFSSQILFFLMTFLFVKYIIKQSTVLSIVSTLLVYLIEQLVYGFTAPLNYLIFTSDINTDIYKFDINMGLSSLITIIIAGFIYWYSSKKFNIKVMNFDKYIAILMIPLLLIILFMQSFEYKSWDCKAAIKYFYN